MGLIYGSYYIILPLIEKLRSWNSDPIFLVSKIYEFQKKIFDSLSSEGEPPLASKTPVLISQKV